MAEHRLDAEQIHKEWNNALPPRLTIDPGDTVVFDTRDAADRYYSRASTHDDVVRRGPFSGHPLTGPVRVRGARPGDTLVVEVLDVRPALDWGWTAIRPGRGLLPEADFAKPYLNIWDLGDGRHARMGDRVVVPIEAFPGVMGVALDEPGGHSTMPPRRNGGNMDIRQLAAGATVYLPVLVEGALFSVGDAHAAQGDGEVCVTGIESPMYAALRFTLHADRPIPAPQYRTAPGALTPHVDNGFYGTTGVGPDLYVAAQEAVRAMIDHLSESYDLSREDAYVLSSLAVDLKISEVVDAGQYVVSAVLPLAIFRD